MQILLLSNVSYSNSCGFTASERDGHVCVLVMESQQSPAEGVREKARGLKNANGESKCCSVLVSVSLDAR